MENYTTVDEVQVFFIDAIPLSYPTTFQVGDVELDKAGKEAREANLPELTEEDKEKREKKGKERLSKEDERKRKEDEKLNIDLDKIVIKKRDKKVEEKSSDDKVLGNSKSQTGFIRQALLHVKGGRGHPLTWGFPRQI